ncbi:unnamed protein product [Peronospora belbahrii]|uniref:Uncharacterized protein n=1 Tax=Peronospora belbahrii TaxID=622444 RepID=A0AAU9KJB2_9STRA|nr:unnamed protein product [Peronospora belbahrii]CAH0513359.1 unnamed protein product [Peronospora belbahrii]
MSARTSQRRGHAAAYGALPGTPISEIRTRKWTKGLKTVGHLIIPKWIPDQENPTEALQKGAYKKSKGRKRGAGEVGRMTRSVRQHLDAPLELLSEHPVRVQLSRQSSPARTAMTSSIIPASFPDTMVAATATSYSANQSSDVPNVPIIAQELVEQVHMAAPIAEQATHSITVTTVKDEVASSAPATAASPAPTIQMIPILPSVSNQMMPDVPSDEQLEMALDDLPMLDADDSFNLDVLDPAFLPTPVSREVQATVGNHSSGADLKQQLAEDLSGSDASANSGSSMPSVSPQSSPEVMSRSSSP